MKCEDNRCEDNRCDPYGADGVCVCGCVRVEMTGAERREGERETERGREGACLKSFERDREREERKKGEDNSKRRR